MSPHALHCASHTELCVTSQKFNCIHNATTLLFNLFVCCGRFTILSVVQWLRSTMYICMSSVRQPSHNTKNWNIIEISSEIQQMKSQWKMIWRTDKKKNVNNNNNNMDEQNGRVWFKESINIMKSRGTYRARRASQWANNVDSIEMSLCSFANDEWRHPRDDQLNRSILIV